MTIAVKPRPWPMKLAPILVSRTPSKGFIKIKILYKVFLMSPKTCVVVSILDPIYSKLSQPFLSAIIIGSPVRGGIFTITLVSGAPRSTF